METPNQKRRPVLVVSRDEAIPVLTNVVVAHDEGVCCTFAKSDDSIISGWKSGSK